MKELLSDSSKFEPLKIPPDEHLNFVIFRTKLKTFLKAFMIKRV